MAGGGVDSHGYSKNIRIAMAGGTDFGIAVSAVRMSALVLSVTNRRKARSGAAMDFDCNGTGHGL